MFLVLESRFLLAWEFEYVWCLFACSLLFCVSLRVVCLVADEMDFTHT